MKIPQTAINSSIQSFIDQCWYHARRASRESISHLAAILFTSFFNDCENYVFVLKKILFKPKMDSKVITYYIVEDSGKNIVTFLF